MIWLEKSFPFGGFYASDQDKFANKQLVAAARGDNSYLEMLMVRAEPKNYTTDRIIIGVPDSAIAEWFSDFASLNGALPTHAALLCGSPNQFEKFFQFPER